MKKLVLITIFNVLLLNFIVGTEILQFAGKPQQDYINSMGIIKVKYGSACETCIRYCTVIRLDEDNFLTAKYCSNYKSYIGKTYVATDLRMSSVDRLILNELIKKDKPQFLVSRVDSYNWTIFKQTDDERGNPEYVSKIEANLDNEEAEEPSLANNIINKENYKKYFLCEDPCSKNNFVLQDHYKGYLIYSESTSSELGLKLNVLQLHPKAIFYDVEKNNVLTKPLVVQGKSLVTEKFYGSVLLICSETHCLLGGVYTGETNKNFGVFSGPDESNNNEIMNDLKNLKPIKSSNKFKQTAKQIADAQKAQKKTQQNIENNRKSIAETVNGEKTLNLKSIFGPNTRSSQSSESLSRGYQFESSARGYDSSNYNSNYNSDDDSNYNSDDDSNYNSDDDSNDDSRRF